MRYKHSVSDEASKFPHRWRLSWPGNVCLDCGDGDPFEACVATPDCVCIGDGVVLDDPRPAVLAPPLPGCKVHLTPCPAKALVAVRDAVENDAVTMASQDSVISYTFEEQKYLLDTLERILGIEVMFMSDRSSLSDFDIAIDEATSLGAALGVPVGVGDHLVDILKRIRAAKAQ